MIYDKLSRRHTTIFLDNILLSDCHRHSIVWLPICHCCSYRCSLTRWHYLSSGSPSPRPWNMDNWIENLIMSRPSEWNPLNNNSYLMHPFTHHPPGNGSVDWIWPIQLRILGETMVQVNMNGDLMAHSLNALIVLLLLKWSLNLWHDKNINYSI